MASILPRAAPRAIRTFPRVVAQPKINIQRPLRPLQPLPCDTRLATSPSPWIRRLAFSFPSRVLANDYSAPNFKAKTTHGDIDFHEFISNSLAVLFSHPADFTPVCTTDLGAFAKLKDEFEKRG